MFQTEQRVRRKAEPVKALRRRMKPAARANSSARAVKRACKQPARRIRCTVRTPGGLVSGKLSLSLGALFAPALTPMGRRSHQPQQPTAPTATSSTSPADPPASPVTSHQPVPLHLSPNRSDALPSETGGEQG